MYSLLRPGLRSGVLTSSDVSGRGFAALRLFTSTGIDAGRFHSYDGSMATQLTPEEAIERARRLQDDRLNAVRGVAEARQRLVDVHDETARELAEMQARIAERVAAAERDDVRAYNAALAAGWSGDELRKIGLPEPEKKARAKRRTTRRPAAPKPSPEQSEETSEPAPALG